MSKKLMTTITIITFITLMSVYFLFFYGGEEHPDQTYLDYCRKIQTPSMKKTCIAMIEKDFSICEKIPYFDKYCYDCVSALIQNPSLCESLSGYPKSACYHNIAKLKKDTSFCEKVSWFDICYWDLARLTNDASLCRKMGAECEEYQCLAEVTGNSSYCEKVPDTSEREMCFKKLSDGKDISICEIYVPERGGVTYMSSCVYNIAKETGNISACLLITSDEFKWRCLAELAGSERICNRAENQFWKDFCLVEVLKNKLIHQE